MATAPMTELNSAILKAIREIDWAKVIEGLAKLIPPEPAKSRLDRFCLTHDLNDPNCVCSKPKPPRLGLIEGEATSAGKSTATLRLVETPVFVVAKKEKTA